MQTRCRQVKAVRSTRRLSRWRDASCGRSGGTRRCACAIDTMMRRQQFRDHRCCSNHNMPPRRTKRAKHTISTNRTHGRRSSRLVLCSDSLLPGGSAHPLHPTHVHVQQRHRRESHRPRGHDRAQPARPAERAHALDAVATRSRRSATCTWKSACGRSSSPAPAPRSAPAWTSTKCTPPPRCPITRSSKIGATRPRPIARSWRK